MNDINREELAKSYFREGYNCAQAVVLAFKDLVNIDEKTLVKLASPFGGGMGRLRETCGAFSGILIIFGLINGYDDITKIECKTNTYKDVQYLGEKFTKECGSIRCMDLLNISGKDDYTPSIRDENFYKTRPCLNIIGTAAKILSDYLKK